METDGNGEGEARTDPMTPIFVCVLDIVPVDEEKEGLDCCESVVFAV
jgi:hypothetical protein